MIFTSHYSGHAIGKRTSISIHPPKGWKGGHLQLFAPTKDLLEFWKKSSQDADAWEEYKEQFKAIIQQRMPQVKDWVKGLYSDENVTLLCYPEKYCHRSLVGLIIEKHRPDCWGGEIGDANSAKLTEVYKRLLKMSAPTVTDENGEILPQVFKGLPAIGSTVWIGCESAEVVGHWSKDRVMLAGDALYGSYPVESVSTIQPVIYKQNNVVALSFQKKSRKQKGVEGQQALL
ncbi:MAG: hypothetical protein KatS3mg087_0649 [Patescibacteria group bacterium]|nr:MAG: hypothetical protein KatS3mg087_0649 [Patescibacteria group bacterium]